MRTRKRYELAIGQDRDRAYEAIERFLLTRADSVRLTPIRTADIRDIFTLGKSRASRKRKEAAALAGLEKDLLRTVENAQGYDPVTGSGCRTHFLYRLSPRLRRMLHAQTLFWHPWVEPGGPGDTHARDLWYTSERFAGLEDPVFFARDEVIGFAITHEQMAVLFLTDAERERLVREGVAFDDGPSHAVPRTESIANRTASGKEASGIHRKVPRLRR